MNSVIRKKLQLKLDELEFFGDIKGNYYCAVDPGTVSGVIVVAHESGTVAFRSPLPIEDKEISFVMLRDMVSKIHKVFKPKAYVVEKVSYIRGERVAKAANFSFAKAVGIIESVFKCLDISILQPEPKRWQDKMFSGVEKVYVKTPRGRTKHDTKATALAVVKKHYPNADMTKSDAAKKTDHNIVDAFLLCMYGKKLDNERV
jgi:hypothetical protein